MYHISNKLTKKSDKKENDTKNEEGGIKKEGMLNSTISSSAVLCRVNFPPGEREVHRADRQLFLYLARPSQGPGRDHNDPR